VVGLLVLIGDLVLPLLAVVLIVILVIERVLPWQFRLLRMCIQNL